MSKKLKLVCGLLIVLVFLPFCLIRAEEIGAPQGDPPTVYSSISEFVQELVVKFKIFFSFGDKNKAEEYTELAQDKFTEYKEAVENGNLDEAKKAWDKYKIYLDKALFFAGKVIESEQAQKLLEEIKKGATQNMEEIKIELGKLPAEARAKYEEAAAGIKAEVDRIYKYFKP